MRNEWEQHKPLDILLADATCGSPLSSDLCHLLRSVNWLSVAVAPFGPGHKNLNPRAYSLVVLLVPALSGNEQQQLLATLDTRDVPVIVAALDPESESLSHWMDCGAADYFSPPWSIASILPRIRKAARRLMPRTDDAGKKKLALDQMVGQSAAFRQVIERIPAVAACDAAVLVTGETGTGKELCARAIHYLGPRSRQPFVPLNCGAIPVDLMENELFGHSAGAYTHATARQGGIIAEAEGGTLFLDEVDSLPLAAQIKLLRFLQSKEYRPLGSPKTLTADVRVVAATNADPAAAVRSGRMRQDLYYRLSVIPMRLPSLRERREDVPLLVSHFQARYAREYGRTVYALPDDVIRRLMAYDWPGNVRELENVVARLVALNSLSDLPLDDVDLPVEADRGESSSLRVAKGQFERAYIEDKLRCCGGNISHAAQAAGKDRRAFWELIRKHRIQVEQFRLGAASGQ